MVSILLHAQQTDPGDNYFDAYDVKLEYIEQLTIDKDVEITELKEYKHFVIWSEHFGTKHDENGSMSAFGEAINDTTLTWMGTWSLSGSIMLLMGCGRI